MDRSQLFALYFSGLAGWRFHPGYLREGAKAPSIEECAMIAHKMCDLTEEWEKCRGLM